MNGLWVCAGVGIVAVVIALVLVTFYNHLVRLRNLVNNAWAQIEVQLKQRYDLIPNLVETVKGYASHEQSTFERVIEARNLAMSATGAEAQGAAENMLSGALKSIFALAESYPDLKANENFLRLQDDLTKIEAKIAYARQSYNDTVMEYQTAIQSFPANLVAGTLGFGPREFFEAEPAADAAPKVDFS